MTDHDFDQQFASLGGVEPPERLQQRTLAAYRAERARDGRRNRVVAAVGMLTMAALTLLVVQEEPTVGDPATMVERGAGEAAAAVSVKVAVTRAGRPDAAERFASTQRYSVGDTLHFRVSASKPLTLTLRHDHATLWTGPVPEGESDLPVGYALEPSAGPSRLVFEGGAEAVVVELPAVAASEVAP